MAEELQAFAAYAYDTGSRIKQWLILAVVVTTVMALVAGFTISAWLLILLAIPVSLGIHTARAGYDRTLLIANRYLILGETIIYYQSVSRARLDRQRESLTITADKGRQLVISADRFPTNARKPDKIRANRSAKFNKVADKVIKRLKETVPDSVVA